MGFDLLGFVVLLLSLLVATVVQVGLALAAMFAMHRYMPDLLPEKTYGHFDFDSFQMPQFTEMLTRLILVFLGPTLVLHALEYILIGFSIRRYPVLVCSVLFVLEVAAIGAGLFLLFKLDKLRLGILAAVSALVYLLLLTMFLYRMMS